jgi:hypothetical protein
VSGTGLCAQPGGILHRAAAAALPLFQLRVYACWIAPACTRIRHSPFLPPLHSSLRKPPRSRASRAPCCTRRHGVSVVAPPPLVVRSRSRSPSLAGSSSGCFDKSDVFRLLSSKFNKYAEDDDKDYDNVFQSRRGPACVRCLFVMLRRVL